MLRNQFYKYGDDKFKLSAHLHFGKEIFDNMLANKHITALINAETNESISYEEMAQQTADIALSLTRMGVRKGDVISICSGKRFEVLPTILGIVCAGGIFTPTDWTSGAPPLLHRLKIGNPTIMFCSPEAYEIHKTSFEEYGGIEQYIMYGNGKQDGALSFGEFLTETAENLNDFEPTPVDGCTDLCLIVYSSGTTGLPKGVPHTHMSSLSNSESVLSDKFRHSIALNMREWYYTYGLIFTLSCLRAACTVVYHRNKSEATVLQTVQDYKINLLQSIPSEIVRFNKSALLKNYDLSSVEWIITSNSPITENAVNTVKERFPNLKNVLQLYGMAEGGCICNEANAPLGPRSGSSGVPCPGFIIKVVDLDTRETLGPNQRGEILLKGPSVIKASTFASYRECAREGIENVQPETKDAEGFFLTGDLGYYDEDNYFYVVNRLKELIKFNDISIAPAEFESILEQHPAVREAGVMGLPHEQFEEAPVAFIALQPGATASEEELVEYLHSKVPFVMRLAGGVRFVDQLPRGAGAKLDRQELRRMLGIIS